VYSTDISTLARLDHVLEQAEVSAVGRTNDVDEGAALVTRFRPEVLVAAADAKGVERTLECVRRSRKASPTTKAVVLAPARAREQIEAAFAAGVDVYCVSTAPDADVATAIRQAFERSIFQPARRTDRRRAGGAAGGVAPAPRLTRREREILRLVGEGHSNFQLAQLLCVTEQTVKFHLSNVYRKLEVSNRTGASRWAQVHGLLERRMGETAGH